MPPQPIPNGQKNYSGRLAASLWLLPERRCIILKRNGTAHQKVGRTGSRFAERREVPDGQAEGLQQASGFCQSAAVLKKVARDDPDTVTAAPFRA